MRLDHRTDTAPYNLLMAILCMTAARTIVPHGPPPEHDPSLMDILRVFGNLATWILLTVWSFMFAWRAWRNR